METKFHFLLLLVFFAHQVLLNFGNGEIGKERKKAGDGDGQLTNSRPERLVLLVEEEHERQHDEDGGDVIGGKNLEKQSQNWFEDDLLTMLIDFVLSPKWRSTVERMLEM